ncbi:hypothetical protein XCR_3690 [Xanthomonas campestris pv. raphani 756C]|nr:hypothetical protein XCR_3690 [Xanthomonas campestris pv. raphani 756C]
MERAIAPGAQQRRWCTPALVAADVTALWLSCGRVQATALADGSAPLQWRSADAG